MGPNDTSIPGDKTHRLTIMTGSEDFIYTEWGW